MTGQRRKPRFLVAETFAIGSAELLITRLVIVPVEELGHKRPFSSAAGQLNKTFGGGPFRKRNRLFGNQFANLLHYEPGIHRVGDHQRQIGFSLSRSRTSS